MRSILYHLTALSVIVCISCDKADDNYTVQRTGSTFVLNNGNWGDNDANIGIYDPAAKAFTPMAFMAANGYGLGDLGQDMISFGDDIYIAVNGSQTIFVTGRDLKVKKRIDCSNEGVRLSPRFLACSESKVYVSYYEGYVGEIDPNDYSVRLTPVRQNPEGIAVAGDKIYVVESEAYLFPEYGNTVAVVSADEFVKTGEITVSLNPVAVVSDDAGRYVYVFSYGNYGSVPSMLQVIDTSTGAVSQTDYMSVIDMAKRGDVLYILCAGSDSDWNPLPGTVYSHDMATNTPKGPFVKDSTVLPEAYSISASSDGYLYVGCSDYKNTGDVYVFTSDGKLYDRFDSQGLNPISVL